MLQVYQPHDCKSVIIDNPNKQNLISRLNTVNWTPLMRLNSCEEQLDFFQSVVHVALNSCIPMRTVRHHPNDKPWITPVIK